MGHRKDSPEFAASRETTDRIRRHYRNIGLSTGWDRSRWLAFCRHFNGCTEVEVAAMFNIEMKTLRTAFSLSGKLPKAVTTYLSWVESAVLEHRGIVSRPVLPFHLMNL